MHDPEKNGFRVSGGPPVDKDSPDDITLRNVRLAKYILANKGVHVPAYVLARSLLSSLTPSRPDTLRKFGEAKTPPVETVDSLTEKIKELKEQHAKDLEKLFGFQLSEYHQELIDHRICHDDSEYMDIDEAYPDQVAFKNALQVCGATRVSSLADVDQDLDSQVLKMDRLKRDMDDAFSTLRYTYLKTLMHFVMRRNKLKSEDKAARQKRDAWFPQTTQQYYHITERDHQLRVARFLTSSATEQEKMMDEFQWPYRAVQPLLSAYKSNLAFKNDVKHAISGLIVADPRRRTSKPSEDTPVFTRFSPLS
ncbi:hypothetical protein OG21DRAFT_1535758 [Imleria badia]|nr:hypothetical protein OG21DRAFT_1535758 [Imleria badia]